MTDNDRPVLTGFVEGLPVDGSILMLGQDHATWGEYALGDAGGGRSVAALSVGVDPRSPSMSSKGSRAYPNEDALLVAEQGDRALLAVADAHHGHQASHALMVALRNAGPDIPEDADALGELLLGLRCEIEETVSSSTLLVAVLDRATARGFGTSFGDCALTLIDDSGARFLNLRRAQYLSPRPDTGVDPDEGLRLEFACPPGALLVACTDGVHECHYRSPQTSIGARHLHEIFLRTGPDPAAFAPALAERALAGVDGHPGGQDNIALIATATGADH